MATRPHSYLGSRICTLKILQWLGAMHIVRDCCRDFWIRSCDTLDAVSNLFAILPVATPQGPRVKATPGVCSPLCFGDTHNRGKYFLRRGHRERKCRQRGWKCCQINQYTFKTILLESLNCRSWASTDDHKKLNGLKICVLSLYSMWKHKFSKKI